MTRRILAFLLLAVSAASAQIINAPSQYSVLAGIGIPVILAPNGTVATNGTITLGTALPAIFPIAWTCLPAGAISGGAKGCYYSTYSSTTVGQIYTNFVDPSSTTFVPFIPASPVPAVGSNSAYTQTTSTYVPLENVNIPANAMGPNGDVRATYVTAVPNNANTKSILLGLTGSGLSGSLASIATNRTQIEFHNGGVASTNYYFATLGAFSTSGNAPGVLNIDTTVAQPLKFQCNLSTATDYCIVVNALVELFHGN